MIKVVLDTNIVVSANLQPQGLPALALRLAVNRKIQMYISPAVLAEYETVLKRPRFKLSSERIAGVLDLIHRNSIVLTDLPTVTVLNDQNANRFLECAQAAEADFLVTGNTKHFPEQWKKTYRVTARQLLERVGPELLG